MPWYVMHTKPQKEELLYQQFRTRGIDAYYPRIKVKPVNPRARKRKPYFPGYVFIKTELDALGTSRFKWMPGSIGIVHFDNEPVSVPDDVMRAIRQKVDQVNTLDGKLAQKFKPGEPVAIHSGPFAGYCAIFDSHLPGQERVRVLMQLLRQRQIGVELSCDQINHIESRQ